MLEQQSEQVRAFLLETSVLERLSAAPLRCCAPADRAARRCWSRWSEAGLFLVPLDEVRGWWRYHHLSPTCCVPGCPREQPGLVGQLHRNAAAWCEEHGLADDAIRQAVAAGEETWAARLIEQHFDEVFFLRSGKAATVPPVAVGASR